MVIAQNYLDELCESTTPSMLMKNNDPNECLTALSVKKNDAPAVSKNTLSVHYDHDREKMLRGRQQLFWNQLY